MLLSFGPVAGDPWQTRSPGDDGYDPEYDTSVHLHTAMGLIRSRPEIAEAIYYNFGDFGGAGSLFQTSGTRLDTRIVSVNRDGQVFLANMDGQTDVYGAFVSCGVTGQLK
jgi:hypothetical protein